jgi:hypothetical protein
MEDVDKKWVDALRRFIGNGTGYVPTYRLEDGSVDANKTLEAVFGLFDIKPRVEVSKRA